MFLLFYLYKWIIASLKEFLLDSLQKVFFTLNFLTLMSKKTISFQPMTNLDDQPQYILVVQVDLDTARIPLAIKKAILNFSNHNIPFHFHLSDPSQIN